MTSVSVDSFWVFMHNVSELCNGSRNHPLFSVLTVDGFFVGNVTIFETFDDPYETRAMISRLNFSTLYTIYVFARTKKGRGEAYYFDAKTTVDGRK